MTIDRLRARAPSPCTCRALKASTTLSGLKGRREKVTYGDVYHQNEVEQSKYNFDLADTSVLLRHFEDYESACRSLLERVDLLCPPTSRC